MSDFAENTPCAFCRKSVLTPMAGSTLCPWCYQGECRFSSEHGIYETAGALKQHYQAVHNIAPVLQT